MRMQVAVLVRKSDSPVDLEMTRGVMEFLGYIVDVLMEELAPLDPSKGINVIVFRPRETGDRVLALAFKPDEVGVVTAFLAAVGALEAPEMRLGMGTLYALGSGRQLHIAIEARYVPGSGLTVTDAWSNADLPMDKLIGERFDVDEFFGDVMGTIRA